MIKKVCTCDRCGDEIEPHSRRIKKGETVLEDPKFKAANINIIDKTENEIVCNVLHFDFCSKCYDEFLEKFLGGIS